MFREAFVDRAYLPDGTLVPRTQEGAVLHDPDAWWPRPCVSQHARRFWP